MFAINSCKPNYTNKKTYNIQVGQTFELYINENSCCHNCWLKANALKSIQLVEKKLVEPAPDDCDGCTSTYAWLFKAIAVGRDTITIEKAFATINCDDLKKESSKSENSFIVTVQ